MNEYIELLQEKFENEAPNVDELTVKNVSKKGDNLYEVTLLVFFSNKENEVGVDYIEELMKVEGFLIDSFHAMPQQKQIGITGTINL